MKLSIVHTALILSILCGAFVTNVEAQEVPSTTLHLGDTSQQVLLLQRVLNQAPDTQVAATGTGSPGMESTHFGTKTLDAVKRYQVKYRTEILTPASLGAPTGVVGPLTLQRLQKTLAVSSSYSISSTTFSPTTTAHKAANLSDPFNVYLAAVTKLGIQQGYSTTTLALITDALRTASATTTDTVAQFYKEQQAQYQKKVSLEAHKPLVERVFDKLVASAAHVFMPQHAQAATGLPFGGFVTYAIPCTCTPWVTSIFVALPTPTPTSNFILDYVNGTQAFGWYTLPTPTVATLGEYEPGVQSCYIVVPHTCIPLPAVGTITPEVGSSL